MTAHDYRTSTIPADTVGISIGLEPDRELYEALQTELPAVYLVGDAQSVRNVMGAIWDGYEVARAV